MAHYSSKLSCSKLLPFLCFVLVSCDSGAPQSAVTLDGSGESMLSAPPELLQSRMINQSMLFPVATINGSSIELNLGGGGSWSGSFDLPGAGNHLLEVVWSENYENSVLPLAKFGPIALNSESTRAIDVDTYVFQIYDNDEDGFSNFFERDNGMDPFNPEAESANLERPQNETPTAGPSGASTQRLSRVLRDLDNDGQTDIVQTLRYNAMGLHVSAEIDNNLDGLPETRVTYTYRNGNNVTNEVSLNIASSAVLWLWNHAYDDQGLPVSRLYEDQTGCCENRIFEYHRNQEGVVTGWSRDNGVDGSVEEVATFEFDEQNNVRAIRIDRGMDGSIETSLVYTYNSSGSVVRYENYRGLEEGSPRSVWLYEYEQGICVEPVRVDLVGNLCFTP